MRSPSRHLPRLTVFAAALALALVGGRAFAWTRPGHMVTAAIAYRELAATDPQVLEQIEAILAQHPDPGPFQVAAGREEGATRAIRLFLEAARWPDDVRTGPYDHPTWHYQIRPLVAPGSRLSPPVAVRGSAHEALALNESLLRDPGTTLPERAIALSWVMHIVGDLHQPLHTAEGFSDAWPDGDGGGSHIYVLDPETGKPISLHWFWDDSVNRSADPDVAMAVAAELTARFPRTHFAAALGDDRHSGVDDVDRWLGESRALAARLTYRGDAPSAASPQSATAAAAAYLTDTRAASAERVALAGYRMADLLRALFKRP